ncbi:MAG: class II fumarate hydratase [Spirochaetota bacterium]
MKTRTEKDTLGPVEIPIDKYWGAQTQRALSNFKIGIEKMPIEIIRAFAHLKKAAAAANKELGILSPEKAELIARVCDEIYTGKLDEHFPLGVWQTGSGTQTNMNINEVIANRAHVLSGGKLDEEKKFIHPNDDVNQSQSTNDAFPAAMHIAAYTVLVTRTIPGIEGLRTTLAGKAAEFEGIVKTGRTHLMDATPLTLGQEFSAYVSQIDFGLASLKESLADLSELALGGTAVGTGLNAPKDFANLAVGKIARITGFPFIPARNKFSALSSHDAMVKTSGSLKTIAVSLMKIANDIRLLASGPRCGIGELILPENEPGSSIMPGKVNPTQVEALTMVCVQVIGNDTAITIAGTHGHLQLNTFKPVIIFNLLTSARLLGDAAESFNARCASGIKPNTEVINRYLADSLMLVTALSPHIGYEKAAQIARKAHREGKTLRAAALELGFVTDEQFSQLVDPGKMV